MSGIAGKLSRHVLGMKFMRKTKDHADKQKVEKVHRQHFAPIEASSTLKKEIVGGIKAESTSTSSTSTSVIVEELWSYNQCERYIFGRQSFGGFNPTVENNVKKGIWKPFYLDEAENPQDDSSEDEDIKNQSDVDVSDEEMAKTYGSLVGTLAKRFRKRHKQEEEEESKIKSEDKRKGRKRSNWGKKFQRGNKDNKNLSAKNQYPERNERGNRPGKNWSWKGNKGKRQRESTGSTGFQDGGRGPSSKQGGPSPKRGRGNGDHEQEAPPQKRRKFLKPSDD